jgi:hypothetical protein
MLLLYCCDLRMSLPYRLQEGRTWDFGPCPGLEPGSSIRAGHNAALFDTLSLQESGNSSSQTVTLRDSALPRSRCPLR